MSTFDSPSEPASAGARLINHDFGVVAPGDNFFFVPVGLPANEEVKTPFVPCIRSPMHKDVFALCRNANKDGVPSAWVQISNNTGNPFALGMVAIAVLFYDLQRLL